MHIKSFSTDRFAGLEDVNINFEDGLNVILGENESGKSTIINGIQSSIFKNIKLLKNNNKDKDFIKNFMPISGGDFIDGKVIISTESGDYEVFREWSNNPNILLKTPNGDLIKDENRVNTILKEALIFGESTYSSIVFAKQKDLKKSIDNIIVDEDITKELSDLLRQTLMELDGVSIDVIKKNLDLELDDLFKRWDIEKNYPENNRGINNPYKVGIGKVLESFYEKENLRIVTDRAFENEKNFEEVSKKLKEISEYRNKCHSEKIDLEVLSEDINKRSILESNMALINKNLNEYTDINTQWPKNEQKLEFYIEELEKLEKRKEKFEKELLEVKKSIRKRELIQRIDKIKKINSEKDILEESLKNCKNIVDEDISLLESLNKEIINIETAINAGKMILKLNNSKKEIFIKRDLEKEEALEENIEYSSKGFISISNEDFSIEIKSGEIDYDELSKKHLLLKSDFENSLKRLEIKDIEEGKENNKNIKEIQYNILKKSEEINYILSNSKLEKLQEELKDLEDIEENIDESLINFELKNINNEIIEKKSTIKINEEKINFWKEKYETQDRLFDMVIEEKTNLKFKEKEYEKLKPLPEEFDSTDSFLKRLSFLKEESSNLDEEVLNLRTLHLEAKNNLSDETYEELKKSSIEAQRNFEKNLNRGIKLLKIQKVFFQVKEDLEMDPMESLVKEFKRVLSTITLGKYDNSSIDETFEIELLKNGNKVPLELLSAGTYDSVALAFRFAILKHLFEENSGYVVLDDCLVDLDPMRKKEAVALIQEFGKENQIIFTTCDPTTAQMLGGNIIEL